MHPVSFFVHALSVFSLILGNCEPFGAGNIIGMLSKLGKHTAIVITILFLFSAQSMRMS